MSTANKFRESDPVRIIAHPCRYFDRVATVGEVVDGKFRVDGLEPWALWFRADELVLAERRMEGA